ncbi:DUF7346 family protein [Natranaeroarchaeum sulfidigenes]|uniref:Transcriptional regulator, HTH domain n=1 Tax=Natranaeroarchaeum sulfidigenes TaxID=2784880 RepID=A0A897MVW5_9EURY|nr:hypothetical protein [Natranaeroarchaeum sulfidigenes]QSG03223.1 Transcriptional regulator, HTH domain [Natranaeroarchaeum sulfidigenes]
MRTVRDSSGKQYIVVKSSADSSLVRDPEDGNERYVDNDRLEPVNGVSPLEAAASGVSTPVRQLLRGVHDDTDLGLLAELSDRGPTPVRDMMREYDLCESDLYGRLAELRAAGLVEECRIADERGYDATARTVEALATLRAND